MHSNYILEKPMTTTQFCTIKIQNKSYKIKCPEAEIENLQLAAEKLTHQLSKKNSQSRKLDEYQNLLMAALHISHELILCEAQQTQQREQLARFINTLESAVGVD